MSIPTTKSILDTMPIRVEVKDYSDLGKKGAIVWCNENCTGNWLPVNGGKAIAFENDEDAVAFKLHFA